jgi:hypothetical protein
MRAGGPRTQDRLSPLPLFASWRETNNHAITKRGDTQPIFDCLIWWIGSRMAVELSDGGSESERTHERGREETWRETS